MAEINILDKRDGRNLRGGILEVDGEKVADMSPTEMLELSNSLKEYVVENREKFPKMTYGIIHVGEKSFRVVVGENFPFWEKLNAGEWEPETFEIFNRFLNRDTLFLDVGAWIGPTVLYGGQLAGRTVAFEPDPKAYARLEDNVRANDEAPWRSKISTYRYAVSYEEGEIFIGSRDEVGDSMSSALLVDGDNAWKVRSVDLGAWLDGEVKRGEKVFCKMDIEGYEYSLIPRISKSLENHHVVLYLSLHPTLLMSTYLKGRRGLWPNLVARFKMFRAHRRLMNSLGKAKLEYTNGKPFRRKRELMKSFYYGEFSRGLIAKF